MILAAGLTAPRLPITAAWSRARTKELCFGCSAGREGRSRACTRTAAPLAPFAFAQGELFLSSVCAFVLLHAFVEQGHPAAKAACSGR